MARGMNKTRLGRIAFSAILLTILIPGAAFGAVNWVSKTNVGIGTGGYINASNGEKAVMYFTVSMTAQARSITSIAVTVVRPGAAGTGLQSNMLATLADSAASGVSLYRDGGTLGTFDAGDVRLGVSSIVWASTGTISGGTSETDTATLTFNANNAYPTSGNTNYFIVIQTNGNLANNRSFQIQLNANAIVNSNSTNTFPTTAQSTATIISDTVAPVFTITDNANAAWNISDTITVTVSDTGGSGAGATTYWGYSADAICNASDDANLTSAGLTTTVNTDHADYICFKNTDNAGNVGYSSAIGPLKVDVTAPTAGVVTPANTSSGSYVDGSFDLSATFTDTASGVASCEYFCSGGTGTCDGAWHAGTWGGGACSTTGLTCNNGQALTLNMRATDNVARVGTATSVNRTCDTTTPTQSAWSPANGASVASTSPTTTLTLSENGNCKWSLTDQDYSAMAGDCSGDGATSISCAISGLTDNAANTVYISCADNVGNAETAATNTSLSYNVNAGPPAQSAWNPAKGASIPNGSPTVTLTLSEIGDCKWSLTDQDYSAMAGDCSGDGTTSITCAVSGMPGGASTVYVSCRDALLVADTAATNQNINYTVDTVPPTQSGWNPAGGSTIATTSPSVALTLNENGDCKWSLTDQDYASMTGDCSGDGTTAITCATSGLADNAANSVYFSCRDSAGNMDTAGTNSAVSYTVNVGPPVQSNWQPVDGASIPNNDPTITLNLSENGDCKWSMTDQAYSAMTNDCTGDGTTEALCVTLNISSAVYVACRDAMTPALSDTAATNKLLTYTVDTTLPTMSGYNPASGSTLNTSSPTITFTVSENADCRWAPTSLGYLAMTGDCAGDGTTSASCATSYLSEGAASVYVACRDNAGNIGNTVTLSYTINATPPEQSAWNPASGSTLGATSQTVTLTLGENGDCKWSLSDLAYGSMTGDCTGDNTTSASCAVTGMAEGVNTVHVACRDASGNSDTVDTNTHLTYNVNTGSPLQSNWTPAPGTTINYRTETIYFNLDKNGDCKWSLTDLAYGAMSGDCAGDGTTNISCRPDGLVEGSEYVYIACRDTFGSSDTASSNSNLNYIVDTQHNAEDWWNTSWNYRIPMVLQKPAGMAAADYSRKFLIKTVDFQSIGVDGVDINSVRVARFNGVNWADIPSKAKNWTDQDGDGGMDKADISFVTYSDDLKDASHTSVTYSIYFDITANGAKAAPAYPSLATLKILCVDNDNKSQVCATMAGYTTIDDFSVSITRAASLTDLAYSNLVLFDQLYFGWNAIAKSGAYQLDGYETDIMNYAYNGGRVLTAANDNNGFQFGWMPESTGMILFGSGNATSNMFSPYSAEIFAYPIANALNGATIDNDFRNVTAGYTVMAQDTTNTARKLFLRKYWGAGVYIIGSINANSGARATAASNYFKNSIYWAARYSGNQIQTTLGAMERYAVTSVAIYQSDYATPLTSAKVGETIYVELREGDLEKGVAYNAPVVVTSLMDPAGIVVDLMETGLNTGIFRGTVVLAATSNSQTRQIACDANGMITVTSVSRLETAVTLSVSYTDPVVFNSIDFKTDATYTTTLVDSVSVGSVLYMQALAQDMNSNSTDRIIVKLTSQVDPTGITALLVETGRNTGIFRGTATVAEASNDPQNYIGAADGNTVVAKIFLAQTITDTVDIASTPPLSISSLTVYSSNFTTHITQAVGGDTIYVEAVGVDGNEYGVDYTVASIYSSLTDPVGIRVQLTETGNHTGIYRGTAVIGPASSNSPYIIGAKKVGETITVKSTFDATKLDTLTLMNSEPTNIQSVILKTNGTYATNLAAGLTIGSTLYIELTATDINSLTQDKTDVTIKSDTDPTGIVVTLEESGVNTGEFRGTSVIRSASNDPANEIGASVDDVITIASTVNTSRTDTVTTLTTEPTNVTFTTFMADDLYSAPLAGSVPVGLSVYIEVTATDMNPDSADTTVAQLYSTTYAGGILVTLRESGLNTGKYRGEATVKSYSDDALDFIGATSGDTLTVRSMLDTSKLDTTTVTGSAPKGIFKLGVYASDYVTPITQIHGGDTLYLEATGVDGNTGNPTDVTTVQVTSTTNPTGIAVVLTEAGGTQYADRFRGTVTAREVSSALNGTIQVSNGDTVTLVTDGFAHFENGSGEIWFECEDANDFTPKMTASAGSGVSGGQFAYVPQGSSTGLAEYVLYKNTAGTQTYSAFARVYPIDANGNIFKASMDGAATTDLSGGTAYQAWTDPWKMGSTYSMTQGAHVFQLSNTSRRNDGIQCDKMVVKASGGAPSGFGSAPIKTHPSGSVTVLNTPPTIITAVDLKTSATYATSLTGNLEKTMTLYIELTATDASQYTVDTTTVTVSSSVTDPTGISVTLTESGINTGKYRGIATITAASNDALDQIGANTVEVITVKSDVDQTKLDTVNIDSAAALRVDVVSTTPTTVTRGQTGIAVSFTVSNTGTAAANITGSGITLTNSSDFDIAAVPGNPTQVAGGASGIVFNYTVNVHSGAVSGLNVINANVAGTDALTGAATSDNSATTTDSFTVQGGPALTSSISVSPSQVSIGQAITVTMTVTNSGEAAANAVAPNALTLGGVGTATLASGPTPANAVLAGGGGSQIYTWTYTAATAGAVNFSGKAQGTDANTGAAVSSTTTGSLDVTIKTPASLTSTMTATPATANQGGTITVTITVNNTGGSAANNVVPSAPVLGGTSTATLLTGPIPATFNIPVGGNKSYVWTYTAGAQNGTVNFTAHASGTDENSGATVSSPDTTTSNVTVQSGCTLTNTYVLTPATVSDGQTLTITMTATNTGTSACNLVTPSALTVGGGGAASYMTGPSPANATLAGGANRTFTWNYSAGAIAGPLNFTGNLTATDALTGSPVSSSPGTSNSINVQLKAALDDTFTASPVTVSTGQTITLTKTVTNTGQAGANNVVPTAMTIGGTSSATLVSGPTPASASIAGGASQAYTWTYTASGTPGTLTFTNRVSGTDQNSGAAVATVNKSTNSVTVQAASALTQTIAASPSTANLSQPITLTMTVNNTGAVAANNVTPSAITFGGTSVPSYVTGPTPASANIAGGGSQAFTWTYNANATTKGTTTFTGNASGADANSGATVSSTSGTSNTVNIKTPAALSCTISSVPDVLGVGDAITVTFICSNSGEATANAVVPSAVTVGGTGNALFVSGPVPPNANIVGGGNQTFTFSFTAAAMGTINFTASASGTDANSGLPVSSTPITSDNDIITGNPDAVLSSTIAATPSSINVGSTITVRMTVTNVGESSSSGVSPSVLTITGTGAATKLTGPSPSSATLAANGGSQIFTWTYSVTSAGTIVFNGNATGDNDGIPPPTTVSSPVSPSNTVTAQAAAALSSSITIPAKANYGQTITVSMAVNNTGGAAANNVAPSALTIGGPAGATLVTGPTPASATIAGGGSQTFTWTYTADAVSGSLTFTGNAAGTDSNSGGAVSSTSNSSSACAVQSPASISATLSASPAQVSGGQRPTISLVVTNNGQASANLVTPSGVTLGGTSGAVYYWGPSPANFTIAGGANKTFTWQYTANNTDGTLNFSIGAAGTDANTGAAVTLSPITSADITVQKKAALGMTFTASPGTVSMGQTITLTMLVNNTGTATANNVAPSALTMGGAGGTATLVSGPTPASANIAGGTSQTYTWTYTAGNSPGTVNFTASAAGADGNSAAAVATSAKTTNSVTIKAPANLTSTLSASPANAHDGETITLTMTVNNTGQASANTVAPSVIVLGGTSGSATFENGPTPANAIIIGGGSQVYTWTYVAGATIGTLTFTGNASGTDAYSGAVVSSASSSSPAINIVGAGALTTSISASPLNTITGSQITVTMNVTNTGTAGVVTVTPSTLTVGGSSIANYLSGPTPASYASIAAGQSSSFTWVYTSGNTVGNITFTGNAGGQDQYTLQPVSSTATTSDAVTINTLTPVWKYPASGALAGAVRSSATIRNSVAYIGSDDNYLYAINTTDGSLRWKHFSRDDVVAWPYPIDWPPITVYYGSMGNYAYAVQDMGQDNHPSAWGSDGVNVGNRIVSSTVTDGVKMYFGCYDDKVHALDILTGVQSWLSPTLNGDLISSPSVFNTEIYIGSTDGNFYALNIADGTFLRSFPTGGTVEGLPWTDPDGSIYVGSTNGKFFAIRSSNFTQKWVFPATGVVGPIISSPWVEGATVFVGSNDGMLYAINKYTGLPRAGFTTFNAGGPIKSSPIVWNGVIYFGSDNGYFYALNAATGALLPGWPYYVGSAVFSSPSVDYDNNLIIVGSNGGVIYAFDAAVLP